ncbi:hypothetical protein LCGC14_0043990 [marine sediment metagenome]|uniref:Uncharacterized protein n=1 Tax=marine sediment metagenome TaxID=412755 RepID=A0A0F9VTL3_9ZZZZ
MQYVDRLRNALSDWRSGLHKTCTRRATTMHVCGACGVTWWTTFADRNELRRPSWCCSSEAHPEIKSQSLAPSRF